MRADRRTRVARAATAGQHDHRDREHVTSGVATNASSPADERAAALPERQRSTRFAARQAAIEVVEELDQTAAGVDEREERESRRRGALASRRATSADRSTRSRRRGPQPDPQPAARSRRRVRRPPGDRARQVHLDAEVGRDRDHPSQRRCRARTRRTPRRQPARRDDRDRRRTRLCRPGPRTLCTRIAFIAGLSARSRLETDVFAFAKRAFRPP